MVCKISLEEELLIHIIQVFSDPRNEYYAARYNGALLPFELLISSKQFISPSNIECGLGFLWNSQL